AVGRQCNELSVGGHGNAAVSAASPPAELVLLYRLFEFLGRFAARQIHHPKPAVHTTRDQSAAVRRQDEFTAVVAAAAVFVFLYDLAGDGFRDFDGALPVGPN